MSKPNELADIFSILNEPPVLEKNHFLFLLGTDTVFTPRPTLDYSYENGETLSYAAQAVVRQLGEHAEQGKVGEALSYNSPSVDVLNGPTTLGTEVGDRIAQAIFLALRAVASGKETLQISAHSRGAVEAIMVVNELARIKKELRAHPEKSLFDILTNAPADEDNTYIAEAVRKLFKSPENESLQARQALLEKLEKTKINTFLMDPVPGGSKFGMKKVRWHSRRFYEKPAADNCELILFRDERTCCFTPIVPEGLQPLVLPGHHGTASGNRYNQQGIEVSDSIENRDTTTLQSLVLCKLFQFLNYSTNGRFNAENYQALKLDHNKLDPVLATFLSASELERRELLLAHYIDVQKNDEAFHSFSNGSYAWLGHQYTADKQRYVHFRGHNHSSMSNVAPGFNNAFLNEEHALLYLRKFINFDALAESSIDETVDHVTKILNKTISQLVEPSPQPDREVTKLLELLANEKGAEIFFSGLSLLVDTMSQKYLRNNLTAAQDERLRNVIEEPFRILAEAKARLTLTDQGKQQQLTYINRIDEIIKNGIKNTVETHHKSLMQQMELLEAQMFHLEAPEVHFYNVFKLFVSNLTSDKDLPAEIFVIQDLLNKIPQTDIKDINSIQEAIIRTVKSLDVQNPLKLEEIEDIISSKSAEHMQHCFEAHETSIKDYLKNIERLDNLLTTLYKDLPSLQNLASEKIITIEPKQLYYRRLGLLELGGRLLLNNQIDLIEKPPYLSENFFNLIKKEAIKLGALSPELLDLREQYLSMSGLVDKQQITLEQQDEFLEKQRETYGAIEQHQQIIYQELQQKNGKLEQDLKETRASFLKEQEALLQAVEVKDELINRLSSDEETEHAALIKMKLLPLTTDYLAHLFNEAKSIYPGLQLNRSGYLPSISGARENNEAYDKITNKFAIVLRLKLSLEDKENNPLPSSRVQNFRDKLLEAETEELAIHRDAAWKRFIKTALVILGIVATGVVPVLGAMMLYSAVSNKRNPLFFNHCSRGEEYVSRCGSELDSLPLSIDEYSEPAHLETSSATDEVDEQNGMVF